MTSRERWKRSRMRASVVSATLSPWPTAAMSAMVRPSPEIMMLMSDVSLRPRNAAEDSEYWFRRHLMPKLGALRLGTAIFHRRRGFRRPGHAVELRALRRQGQLNAPDRLRKSGARENGRGRAPNAAGNARDGDDLRRSIRRMMLTAAWPT